MLDFISEITDFYIPLFNKQNNKIDPDKYSYPKKNQQLQNKHYTMYSSFPHNVTFSIFVNVVMSFQ